MGPRRIEALKTEDCDWQKKAQEAVLNIQDFTVKYFETTARAQKGTAPLLSLLMLMKKTKHAGAIDLCGSELWGDNDFVLMRQAL